MRIAARCGALVMAAALGCASGAPEANELELIRLTPPPGSVVDEATTIDAAFEYKVAAFDSNATYQIAPMFGHNRGGGHTFNTQNLNLPLVMLTQPEGRADLRYPIQREWNDNRLARPLTISFYLIETTRRGTRVIASAGPFTYQ
jgi:hypothetical protein